MRLQRNSGCWLELLAIGCPLAAYAQNNNGEDQIKKLQDAVAAAQGSATTPGCWSAAALVLMMTGPGLALFYGGLVRRKNVLATMMQSFILMAVVTVLWALSATASRSARAMLSSAVCARVFLRGVGVAPNTDYAPTIPHQTFMIYQLMFAIITPALITGAFAERMKFSAMLLFMMLWLLFVYCPLAHMVWGKGGLLNCDSRRQDSRAFDFAGGTVVHISSGVSRAGLRALSRQAHRVSVDADAAAQRGAQLHRRRACCGWAGSASTPAAPLRRRPGYERFRRDALRRRAGSAGLDGR